MAATARSIGRGTRQRDRSAEPILRGDRDRVAYTRAARVQFRKRAWLTQNEIRIRRHHQRERSRQCGWCTGCCGLDGHRVGAGRCPCGHTYGSGHVHGRGRSWTDGCTRRQVASRVRDARTTRNCHGLVKRPGSRDLETNRRRGCPFPNGNARRRRRRKPEVHQMKSDRNAMRQMIAIRTGGFDIEAVIPGSAASSYAKGGFVRRSQRGGRWGASGRWRCRACSATEGYRI